MAAMQFWFAELLEELECQFLCGLQVKCFNWKELENFDFYQQQKLMDITITNKINQHFPLNVQYQIHFLRVLMKNLVRNGKEIHEEIQDHLFRLQEDWTENIPQFHFKHYILPNRDVSLMFRESHFFMSNGSVAEPSTLQSSLALTNYLLQHPHLVQQKNVLELGDGYGLCSFLLLRCCDVRRMFNIMESQMWADLMIANISINFPNAIKQCSGLYKINDQVLAILPMSNAQFTKCEISLSSFRTEVLLLPLVVNENSEFTELLQAIDFVFASTSQPILMYLAVTVQNVENLNTLICLLTLEYYKITELDHIEPERSDLYWDRSVPVALYQIRQHPDHLKYSMG